MKYYPPHRFVPIVFTPKIIKYFPLIARKWNGFKGKTTQKHFLKVIKLIDLFKKKYYQLNKKWKAIGHQISPCLDEIEALALDMKKMK